MRLVNGVMNNHDTISLLRQGPTEWNRWAETMLAQRAALENSNSWNANAEKWLDDATADFSNCIISNDLSFNGLIFPGEAVFRSTVFENADLRRTRFEGLAQFTDSVFPESALFRWTRFKLGAVFSRASFNKDV
ncbi:MAG: pentapeptide repeat-containing protein, partial [Rhodomicrobium sp.]|nr:pentapeptide repeat-containing protein [Rhodomicrobium sp.]